MCVCVCFCVCVCALLCVCVVCVSACGVLTKYGRTTMRPEVILALRRRNSRKM